MKFEVHLEVADVAAEELVEAIKTALSTLNLPNGDRLYLDDSAIEVTPKE